MPTLNLKATLQAYSKAPFYGDYIRQPQSLLGSDYDPNLTYVLKDGSWIDLAKASSELGISIDELKSYISQVESRVRDNIRIEQDLANPNDLKFYDYNNIPTPIILPTAKTDNVTVGINDVGDLYTINNPDEITLKTIVTYESDSDNISESFDIKRDGKYQVVSIFDEKEKAYISGSDIRSRLSAAEKNIRDLESYTQGTGGFLDPNNFGSFVNLSVAEKNNLLNQYAYDQLSGGEAKLIPDQTKVKNIFDGHIWVYIQSDDSWIDEGADTVVTANNDGVVGAVTGIAYDPSNSETKFKISITSDNGIMSVNGLKEEFDTVIYKTEADEQVIPNTYAQRTQIGTLKANNSVEDDDVINQSQFNDWIQNSFMTTDDIYDLVNYNFEIQTFGGNN